MHDHVMSLDHAKSMCIGGIAYRLPIYVTAQQDGSFHDERGQFWTWDRPHVRSRLAERGIAIRENA